MATAPYLAYPYLVLLRPSATHAYLAAQSTQGLLYATENGGSSWVHHAMPPLCGQLLHLSADTNDDLWALCSSAIATDSQAKELYRSSDSGLTWTLVAATHSEASVAGGLPTVGIVGDFTSVGREELVVVLDRGPLLVSRDGGKSWNESDLPGGRVEGLAFPNPSTGWAILNSGEFYRTSDGGIHWGVTR